MNVFAFREGLIAEYARFSVSFTQVRADLMRVRPGEPPTDC